MDADYDPVAGFARAAQSMAETQQILAQTQREIAQTQRLGLRLQRLALLLLGLSLLGIGVLVWHAFTLHAASDVHTQALLELLRRSHP